MNTVIQPLIAVIWITLGLAAGCVIVILYEFACSMHDNRLDKRNVKRENEIRLDAYYVWENAGCPSGQKDKYWLEAETNWEQKHKKRRWLWIHH